jgi:hypothetical protein
VPETIEVAIEAVNFGIRQPPYHQVEGCLRRDLLFFVKSDYDGASI